MHLLVIHCKQIGAISTRTLSLVSSPGFATCLIGGFKLAPIQSVGLSSLNERVSKCKNDVEVKTDMKPFQSKAQLTVSRLSIVSPNWHYVYAVGHPLHVVLSTSSRQ